MFHIDFMDFLDSVKKAVALRKIKAYVRSHEMVSVKQYGEDYTSL